MSITLENTKFRLVLSPEGFAESLIVKQSGAECLSEEKLPFFSLTEERPYHNEIKLSYPTKKTTFPANRIRMENGKLIVGFALLHFEAVVRVEISERYMIFALEDFIVTPDSFGLGVELIQPPVLEFRLVQLPIRPKTHFGQWLNVIWDEEAAVNVLAACPYVKVGAEKQTERHILYGEALRGIQLKNVGVALVASEPGALLDGIDALEIEQDLPRGVASRRSDSINRSYYWSAAICPDNVDQHIAYAKRGGFRQILIYYSAFLAEIGGFAQTGNYIEYNSAFPNGWDDLAHMVEKIKAAGITPGLHVLHSHIGLRSRYLTPIADHRINLSRHLTLAKPLSAEDTTIYVEENPAGSPKFDKMRILKFMGELIQYESFTTEFPYRFTGCKRGFNDTIARAHEIGTIGGILDVSEFCANSAYVNQQTSLQDEIAEQIAKIYDAGFEFVYFDGSEGVNAPFDINVGLAQWRVYRRFGQKPRFCEGAAKSNFSWHMLSGGNAFDVWKSDVFKEMTVLHPFREASHMADDFTRVNFGWWNLDMKQRPDILEYGTALAAAWNCPGAFQANLARFQEHPRTDDILETLRRWEDARECGFITDEIRAELKRTEIEHTLLIDEHGAYELAEWEQVPDAVGGNPEITVFLLERGGKACAVCWNNVGSARLSFPLTDESFQYVEALGGAETAVERTESALILPVDKKRYFISSRSKEELAAAFAQATLL